VKEETTTAANLAVSFAGKGDAGSSCVGCDLRRSRGFTGVFNVKQREPELYGSRAWLCDEGRIPMPSVLTCT